MVILEGKESSQKSKVSSFFAKESVYTNIKKNKGWFIPADELGIDKQLGLRYQSYIASAQYDYGTQADDNYQKTREGSGRAQRRQFAQYPEIEDILDKLKNECIISNAIDETDVVSLKFSDLSSLTNEERVKLSHKLNFFYTMIDGDNLYNEDLFKKFLIDGTLAFEIIYDDIENPTDIIDLIELDPETLTRKVEDNVMYWVQYADTMQERRLTDSRVIYIEFQNSGFSNKVAYIERLIRPYNIYRIVEQAQIIWTIGNASSRRLFTIPTKGMSMAEAAKAVSKAMNKFHENISLDMDNGILDINGTPNIPFNQEYWMPDGDNGSPQVENINTGDSTIVDIPQIEYFRKCLYKISKLPLSRFDEDNQATFFGSDSTAVTRDEIDFNRFCMGLQRKYSMIYKKPILLWARLQGMEKLHQNHFTVDFHTHNVFEEAAQLEMLDKRVQAIASISDSLTDEDGNPMLNKRLLINKYLHISPEFLMKNDKIKEEQDKAKSDGNDADNDEDW